MRKAYFFTLIFVTAIMSNGWGQFSGGAGTQSDPYQIDTAQDLDSIRNILDPDTIYYFLQTQDIDLSGFENWQPLGGGGTSVIFNGRYDGGGHIIYNLAINRPDVANVGLFGSLEPMPGNNEPAVYIKNLGLRNVNVLGGGGTGALVGRVLGTENTSIEGCYVLDGHVRGNSETGGLVGANNSLSSQTNTSRRPKIIESFANVDVEFSGSGTENSKFGGLVGCNAKGDIRDSYSGGRVIIPSGTVDAVGGLVGCMATIGRIDNSYSYGYLQLDGSVTMSGGLIGNKENTTNIVIASSYWDTQASGQATSAGGLGRSTADMQKQGTFAGWSFGTIWDILEDESYPFLLGGDQVSGFEVSGPSTTVAGEYFNLQISNASDVNGVFLNGFLQVTITSNIEGEANGGIVFNSVVQFISGAISITNLALTIAELHELSISIQSIADPKIHPIEITPAAAVSLLIAKQPASQISGTFNNEPAELDTLVVLSVDAYNNISTNGLASGQFVNVAIQSVQSGGIDAVLAGADPIDLFLTGGIASFPNITIDTEGTGYVLRFTSSSAVGLGFIDTQPFDVVNILDLSSFLVNADPVQYQSVPFAVSITDAIDNMGTALAGNVNVQVSSNLEGLIFNQNIDFTSGNAGLTMVLEELNNQILTINVEGITEDQTLPLVVHTDQSTFTLSGFSESKFAGIPFDISVRGATGRNGNFVSSATVVITSNQAGDGEVFNGVVSNFEPNGDVEIPIVLMESTHPNSHILTVTIEGITEPQTVAVVVEGNDSDFLLSTPDSVDAGDPFELSITQAFNELGSREPFDGLNGNYIVTVTSDKEGVVFEEAVSFTDGTPGIQPQITLNQAYPDDHGLTVTIETIVPQKTDTVKVIANVAEQLVITAQNLGATGTHSGTPLSIGSVTVQTVDKVGNPSTRGLDAAQNVVATLHYDASVETNAQLGGTLTLDIQSGTATFENITLDKDGVGYIVRFTSSTPVSLGIVDTDPFTMANVENQAGFDIVDPGPQVAGESFNLFLTNATDAEGNLRQGNYHVLVISTSIQIYFNGDALFIDGETSVPISISAAAHYDLIIRVNSDIDSQEQIDIQVVSADNSTFTFALDPTGNPTAGSLFAVDITNARDKADSLLFGNHMVTFVSNNVDEGTNGLLFGDSLAFSGGIARIEDMSLTNAVAQDLTLSIDWVTNPDTISVVVNPADASNFVITQQPVGGSGNFDDVPVSTGEIGLQFQDHFGNPSSAGLANDLTVTASIESGTGGTLGGTLVKAIIDNQVIFDNLTLDKNGTYTLRFVYNGSPALTPQVSNEFTMTNLENLSGFTVDDPGKQYQNLEFDLQIRNAQDTTGLSLEGGFVVTVTSNQPDGEVYNQLATFSNGEATIPVTLTILATHTLTISLQGITDPVVLENIEVAEDLSGFALALDPATGPYYQSNPFGLVISDAKNMDGVNLGGNFLVTVTSDLADGEVYNAMTSFSNGAVTLPITLATEGTHILTVTIEGITNLTTIEVIVSTNHSGFAVTLAEAGDKTAGVGFDIAITDAIGFDGTALTGENAVVVTSDLSGEIFNGNATFSNGTDTLTLNLTLADLHTLTVSVANITETNDLAVTVLAATVAKMLITTQPTGGSGTGNDIPASIGTTVIHTADEFDNLSVVGLSGTQTVTASIGNDGSLGGNAQLSGTTEHSILGGIATFDDLTLDKDGTGYTLIFTYTGEPLLMAVTSDSFHMTGINLYAISLDVTDPLVFSDEVVGYGPVADSTITISPAGGGAIENLQIALEGANATDFTLSALSATILYQETDVATFTVVPNTGLTAGNYTANVVVTADNGVSEQLVVVFQVREPYAISLDVANPTIFNTVSVGYPQIDSIVVTITNTGANEITGLSVNLSGLNAAAFVVSTVEPTNIISDETATFTLRPENGLTAETYTATVTVNNNQNVPQSFDVSFQVVNEVVWVGETNSWNTASNWNHGSIPDDLVYIIIPNTPSGGNYPVISGGNVTVNNLLIQSGASLTVNAPHRLTIKGGGELIVENNAQITAPGDLRIQENASMVLKPGARVTSSGSFINNAGVGGLVLESSSHDLTASLILNSSLVPATVQRWMPGQQFHVISPPVIGDRLEDFLARNPISRNTSQGIYAMQQYEEEGGWSPFFPLSVTGTMEQGKAYSIRIGPSGGAAVSFQGTLRSGNLSKPISRQVFGWNGLGNPFPSAMGAGQQATNKFLEINATQLDPEYAALWVYSPTLTDYHVINNIPQQGDYILDYLALGQGFIVKAIEGGGNVSFSTNLRSHQSDPFLKNEKIDTPWHSFRLGATKKDDKQVNTFVAFNTHMTKGLDVTYDAGVYDPNPDFMLFTRMPDDYSDLNLSVQALPVENIHELVIPVGFNYPEGGEVTFSLQHLDMPHYMTPVLEDRQTGVFTDLSSGDYMSNIAPGSESTGRFFIHMEDHLYTLHTQVTPEGAGQVLGGGPYLKDTEVQLHASAQDAYVFIDWRDDQGQILGAEEFLDISLHQREQIITANFQLKGDLNNDGWVTTDDITKMIDAVIGRDHNYFHPRVADINGDGILNIQDVVLLVSIGMGDTQQQMPASSETKAWITMENGLVSLTSDGSLAALQFEMILEDASLPGFTLKDDNLLLEWEAHGNIIRGVIYSMDNKPLPGEMLLMESNLETSFTAWGDLLAANTQGDAVTLEGANTTSVTMLLIEKPQLLVYPNPSVGIFYAMISLPEPSRISLSLYDVTGSEVWKSQSKHYQAGIHTLPFSKQNLLPGFYTLKMNLLNNDNKGGYSEYDVKIIIK